MSAYMKVNAVVHGGKYLFRYLPTGPKREYVRSLLERREIFFGYSRRFNDPFDCAIGISFPNLHTLSATDEQDLRQFYRFLMPHEHKLRHSQTTSEKSRREADFGIAHAKHRDQVWLNASAKLVPQAITQSAKSIAILCLTEDPKSIPMWSHYGDKHRGVVLVFDRDALREEDGQDKCFPITYRHAFPSLHEFLDAVSSKDPMEICKLFYCRKHCCWRYEREWRLFAKGTNANPTSDGGTVRVVPPGALVGVILGCMMENKHRTQIKRWAKNRNDSLKIYEATRGHKTFDLIINQTV